MSTVFQDLVLFPLLITLRIVSVGLACTWFMPDPESDSTHAWKRYLFTGARVVLAGVVVSALTALLLGQLGWYSPVTEYAMLAVILMVGLLPAVWRSRERLHGQIRAAVPMALISLAGIMVIMALPRRGEWVLGGWDPGVYISEGVALERSGTFTPQDSLLFDELSDEERAVFTRGNASRTERFPGVVLDAKRARLWYEFFRLHPALIAVFYRCGGLTAALRGNTILGLFTVAVFLALMVRLTSLPHALFALLVLMAQPIWLYHTHTPVSEMLHLLLMLGVGFMVPQRGRSFASAVWLGLLIMGMILNRFSFFPFAAMLVVGMAWLDLERAQRGRVWIERAMQWGAIALAAWIDCRVAPASVRGWSTSVLPVIVKVVGACVAMTTLIDLCGSSATLRKLSETPRWVRATTAWLAVALLVGLWVIGRWGSTTRESDNLLRLIPYLGPVAVGYAIAGALLLTHRKRPVGRTFGTWLFVLFGITCVVLVKKWVVDIYPWATRRYLATTVPLVAILAAYPVARLWQMPTRRCMHRAAVLVLLGVLLGAGAKRSWHAWSRVETPGMVEVLDAIAERIANDDIVVTDTPTWGTPLKLIYGKEVLNGKHMWRRKDAAQMQTGLDALKRLHDSGRRIRFLTSTRTLGLDIYPVAVAPVTLDWQSDETALPAINHSSRANDFEVELKRNVFRLYTWHPS